MNNKEIFYIKERRIYKNWSALRVSHRGGTRPGSEADQALGPLSCGCEAVADTAGRPVSARSAVCGEHIYKYPPMGMEIITRCPLSERGLMRLRSGREVGCVNAQDLQGKEGLQGKEEKERLIIQLKIQQVMLLVSEEKRLVGGLLISIFGILLYLNLIIDLFLRNRLF